jgi:HAMP domain-containing protein
VGVSSAELRGPISALRTLLFIVSAIGCLLAGGAGLLFGRSLASRVNALSDSANRMSLGELSTPVRDPGEAEAKNGLATVMRDEISQLAEQIDQARESFRQAIERLRRR